MYDKYDSPHGDEPQEYQPGPMDSAGEIGGQAMEFVKANWRKILVAAIALAVLFLVYDFFVGSVKNVVFEVIDTEGNPVEGAVVRVLDGSGNEIKKLESGGSLILRTGNYGMDIMAEGYKGVRGKAFSVSDNETVKEELEQDKDLELQGEFPQAFATGEEKKLTLTITNNGNSATDAELVLGGDAKGAMSIEYQKPLKAQAGQNEIEVTLKVGDAPGKSAIGAEKSGSIRIAGLSSAKATVQGKYSLVQFDQKSIKLTIGGAGDRLDYGNVKAGEHVEKPLKLRNDNSFRVENITFEVQVTQAEHGKIPEMQKWFRFSPSNALSVNPKSEELITLATDVPANFGFPLGKDSVTINGVIQGMSSYFSKDIDFRLVVQKPRTSVTLSGLQEIITLSKDETGYKKISDFLEIKNGGEVLLTSFDVRVDCSSTGTSWLTLENGSLESAFGTLAKGTTQSVPYTIEAPASTPEGQIVNCRVGVLYTEPSGNRPSIERRAIIKT